MTVAKHIEFDTWNQPAAGMNATELRAWAQTEIARVQRDLEKISDCRYCMAFENGFCSRWGADVPEEHQPRGCDDWCIDLIPF